MSDNGYKIGEVTTDIPLRIGRGKYEVIWKQAAALSQGECLPITFADRSAALAFATGANTLAKKFGFELARRGLTVYVIKKVPA